MKKLLLGMASFVVGTSARDLSHGNGLDIGLGTQFTSMIDPIASIATTATISVMPFSFSCVSVRPYAGTEGTRILASDGRSVNTRVPSLR